MDPEKDLEKDQFSFAFASAVAVSLRRNDFSEGCG
jgi:hypothetical protein